jgi:hypothetical protein
MTGRYGGSVEGLVTEVNREVFLYKDGSKMYRLKTSSGLELPMDQCAKLDGSANFDTDGVPIFTVTEYTVTSC